MLSIFITHQVHKDTYQADQNQVQQVLYMGALTYHKQNTYSGNTVAKQEEKTRHAVPATLTYFLQPQDLTFLA